MGETEQKEKEQSAVERVGLDYGIKLSYAAVDRSTAENKRDILYSLACFGCMFDERYGADPDPILRKYDCLHLPEPKKLDLYDLAHTLVTLPGVDDETAAELNVTWYMLFAYVLLGETPFDEGVYDDMVRRLHTETVFEGVLHSRYSVYIPATAEELQAQGAPSALIEWYDPYLRYAAVQDEKGIPRETAYCRLLLGKGEFDHALLRSERLLAAYPDDVNIATTVVAARVSLSGVTDAKSRTALLRDTLSLIEEYIERDRGQYLRYYRGLTLLGLGDIDGARTAFEGCLQEDPRFELAALMLRGLDKYTQK